jgi:hypothetical protein
MTCAPDVRWNDKCRAPSRANSVQVCLNDCATTTDYVDKQHYQR